MSALYRLAYLLIPLALVVGVGLLLHHAFVAALGGVQ